jgi:predicted membrane metal-binding protein
VATVAIELALFGGGLALYVRGTRARDRVGRWGLWAMVALLAVFFFGAVTGAAPPNERALAISTLGLWLFVPWSAWIDRHREPVARSAGEQAAGAGRPRAA